jgi:hypothetical protein
MDMTPWIWRHADQSKLNLPTVRSTSDLTEVKVEIHTEIALYITDEDYMSTFIVAVTGNTMTVQG